MLLVVAQPEVLFLTDNLNFGSTGATRATAAYVLASQIHKAGYRVQVLDHFTQQADFFSRLESFLSPDLLFVAISTTFLSPLRAGEISGVRSDSLDSFYSGELWFQDGEELAEWFTKLQSLIARHSPRCKVVIGGVKAQFAIWHQQYYRAVDYVCLGPGDKTLIALADSIKNQKPVAFKEFNGVKVLDNEIDINGKACPAIHWIPEFAVQKGEALPLEVARGCLYNCKFCHHDKMESFKKSPDDLREELTYNYEKFGTTAYYLSDDCINDHPKKVESFCNTVASLPFKIEWVSFARVDVAIRFPETVNMLIDSGARGLYFGLESFNHRVALKAGKGTPTEKIKDFLLDFRERFGEECLLGASFIVGLPGETVESQSETAKWMIDHNVFDFVNIGPLGLMPYVSAFDKLSIDYAEYSRSPEKYGFTKINYEKRSWEHETFTSESAYKMALEIKTRWQALRPWQVIRSIWLYPHLRTLGFSKSEIFDMVRSSSGQKYKASDINQRFAAHKAGYWSQLNTLSGPMSSSGKSPVASISDI